MTEEKKARDEDRSNRTKSPTSARHAAALSVELENRAATTHEDVDVALSRLANAIAVAMGKRARGTLSDKEEKLLISAAKKVGPLHSSTVYTTPLPREQTERVRMLIAEVEPIIKSIWREEDKRMRDGRDIFHLTASRLIYRAMVLGWDCSPEGYTDGSHNEADRALGERLRAGFYGGRLQADIVACWTLMAIGIDESRARNWTYGAV